MTERSLLHRWVYPVLFFAFLWVIFFPDMVFRGKIFLSPMGDLHLVNYSWAVYFQQMFQKGIWPLWNPLAYAGCPYGAGAVSHVSLANLLVVLLNDAPAAWNVQVLLNVFLAAWGTYLYMRKMQVSAFGALIAGTLFGFLPASGSYSDSWPFFLPVGLWLLEEFFTTRRKLILVLLVFNFWVMILNALPQYTLYTGVIFAVYALVRFRSFLGVCILIFAIGLASFYLFRLLELLTLSPRGHMWFINVLLPTHLINMVFPFLFESPFRQETNFFFPKIFGEITQRCLQQGKIGCLYPPYITIAGFSFVVYAWRLKGPLRFFRTAGVGIFLYLMTFPLLAPFYEKIPILAQLPRIDRLYPVLTFCLVVLAGWGSDRILKKEFRVKPIAFFYAALCGILLAGLGLVRLIAHVFQEPLRHFMTRYIQTHVIGGAAHQAPESFYYARIDQFFSFINAWTRWNDPSVLMPIILIMTFLLLIAAWRHDKIRKTFFTAGLMLLIVLDILFIFRAGHHGMASRSEITPPSATIRFLQKQPGVFRVTTLLEEAVAGVGRQRDILAPNLNLQYGLFGIEGYDPLFPGRYSDFVKNFQRDYEPDPAMILSGPESGFDYKMMDFLNVRYFFMKNGVTPKKDLPFMFEDARNKVYANPSYLPRAFLVTDYRLGNIKRDILAILRDPAFDFRKSVVLESKPRFPEKPAPAEFDPDDVSFEIFEPDHVVMKVHASRDSILVSSENYYPGWKAFLDGRETRMLRANYAFRAVEIPQGEHKVEFLFRPASYKWGLGVSCVVLLIGLGALIKSPRYSRDERGSM